MLGGGLWSGNVSYCKSTVSKVVWLRHEEQNKTESSITDQRLEGSKFMMNVAFQPGRWWTIYYLTNASGNIKGKIKLVNE